MIAPHIVGVPVFVLWSFRNSTAFPMVASSLICFPILYFFKSSIKYGIINSHTKNVASENEKMGIK